MRKTKFGVWTITAVTASMILALAPTHRVVAGEGLSAQTLQELAQVRRATARYHNILNAFADGYVDVSFVASGIGCHLVNFEYGFDPAIDLEKPEALVYSDCSGTAGGRSELRSVEYSRVCLSPTCDETPLPEGFSGDHDVWEVFPGGFSSDGMFIPPQWTLHAWIWRHNPDGLFVKVNPAVD